MTLLSQNRVLHFSESKMDSHVIAEFEITAGEWLNFIKLPDDLIKAMIDGLLLKDDALELKYYDAGNTELSISDKQSIRRRISYWPRDFHEITTVEYIKIKENLLSIERNKIPQKTRLFLDHLMIGEALPLEYKQMIYCLLMNAPRLLVIDQALEFIPKDILPAVLKVITRYSQNSGLAIINFTQSPHVIQVFKGREFRIQGTLLSEIISH